MPTEAFPYTAQEIADAYREMGLVPVRRRTAAVQPAPAGSPMQYCGCAAGALIAKELGSAEALWDWFRSVPCGESPECLLGLTDEQYAGLTRGFDGCDPKVQLFDDSSHLAAHAVGRAAARLVGLEPVETQ